MLTVNNLSKTYNSGFFKKTSLLAVDNVSFHISKGECLGVIGESGSGKSTIGKMVAGLLEPTSGEILVEGRDILEGSYVRKKEFRKKVQIIFQEPDGVMDPRWKLGKSMLEPLRIHSNLSKTEQYSKVLKWLDVVGLEEEHLDRYPFELSGGQLQRLALARALLLDPELIVADEPTSSLDVSVQAQILSLVKDIQSKYNLTILFITHDLYVAKQMCNEVVVMKKGKFVERGQVNSVFSMPQDKYTKMLLSAQLPPDMSSRDKLAYAI